MPLMGGVCLGVLEFGVVLSCQLFALDKTLIISPADMKSTPFCGKSQNVIIYAVNFYNGY